MIQVFKLICFGENKVENVQRRAVPTGGPAAGGEPRLVLLAFASEVTAREPTPRLTWTLHPRPGGRLKEKR